MIHTVNLRVNGRKEEVRVPSDRTLLQVLREDLWLTGAKEGCGTGECGACTVLLDGKPVNACLVLAVRCNNREVLTIEGLAEGKQLHPLQEAFIRHGAIQCGFCTPGMILSAKALLDANPHPDEMLVKHALAGNLCRCTGYVGIIKAVMEVANLQGEDASRG
jgi:carbon-monoxide dehydrogenase small subunit